MTFSIPKPTFVGFIILQGLKSRFSGFIYLYNDRSGTIMNDQLRLGILLCIILIACPVFGQRKPRIKGNRSVISVERELPEFTRLVLDEDLEVRLVPGESEGVRIEADDNLIDILRFDVSDQTLTISSFYTITSSKKLELILEYRHLEHIQVTGGKVSGSETLNTDNLELILLEGAGAQLNIRSGFVGLQAEGNSSADLRIEADSLSASLSGYTDSRIYSSGGPLNLSMTGQASLDLEGVAGSLNVSLTDDTRLKASGMEATEVKAFLNTSANARLFAVESIAYEGRGNARLFVYGQPAIQILGMYDSAELHKAPD